MKTVGAFEAKTHLSQLLDEVEKHNEEILIQKRGRDMAYIIPCAKHNIRKKQKISKNIINAFKTIRKKQEQLNRGEIKDMINAGRKR